MNPSKTPENKNQDTIKIGENLFAISLDEYIQIYHEKNDVSIYGKVILINKSGLRLIPEELSHIGYREDDGYRVAYIHKDNDTESPFCDNLLLDEDGKQIARARNIHESRNGIRVISVSDKERAYMKNGIIGEERYSSASYFSDGFAQVTKDYETFYIDEDMNPIFDTPKDYIRISKTDMPYPYVEVVNKDNLHGLYDVEKKAEVVECKYNTVSSNASKDTLSFAMKDADTLKTMLLWDCKNNKSIQ